MKTEKQKMKKLAATALTFLLIGVALTGTYFSEFHKPPKPEIHVNASNPAPNVYQTNNIDPRRYNYIQAPSINANYTTGSNTVTVENIESLIEVHGSSMRPTMFTGDKALAVDYTGRELSEGDIISTGEFVHRIEADYTETSGYYLTRGDNNEGREKVEPEDIESVIIGVLYSDK